MASSTCPRERFALSRGDRRFRLAKDFRERRGSRIEGLRNFVPLLDEKTESVDHLGPSPPFLFLTTLSHPNIATIYEVGEAGEVPFIAMELVEGETLRDVLKHGAITVGRLLEVAGQIAEGLVEAHRAGVLHCDIKPGNVMIDSRSRVRLLDFGMSILATQERRVDESQESFVSRSVSQNSACGGTIPYMAPELLRGAAPDARSDMFAFGVLLYECMTGRLPFPGETAIDIFHGILHQPPVPIRSLAPGIPPALEHVIDRCLSKSPEQRFREMEEVLQSLSRVSVSDPKSEKSVAVLYFENMSEAKADAYFRDGMTEDIITELAKIKQIRVFPRSTIIQYRDKLLTAPEIGQKLDARYVLEGSLRRAANRIRITARLVETRTGHSLWADRYDREMEDVFAIQDEIAESIASALRCVLTEEEKQAIEKVPTADVNAYDVFLRGRQEFHQFRRKNFVEAEKLFRQAIAMDPKYARAFAGVAYCHALLHDFWEASEANRREADEASRKALELDPDLADAYCARGLALSILKKYDEAQVAFDKAIYLDPNLFEAYYFNARVSFARGNLADAAQLYEKASQVRPEDYQALLLLNSVYMGLGRKDEAVEAARRGLAVAAKHLESRPNDARALYLGAIAYSQIGDQERSYEWAQRALAMDPNEPSILYNVGCCFSLLGKTEESLTCLENAIRQGFNQSGWFENDSDLNPLRTHPRFRAMLKKLAK